MLIARPDFIKSWTFQSFYQFQYLWKLYIHKVLPGRKTDWLWPPANKDHSWRKEQAYFGLQLGGKMIPSKKNNNKKTPQKSPQPNRQLQTATAAGGFSGPAQYENH